MKYFLILISTAFLIGCSTVTPVKRTFPDVPADMLSACADLKEVPDTTKLSEVIEVVSGNYINYHECKDKNSDWAAWYKKQKEIFDSVK